jgi:translation initiation factor IF-1
VAEDRVEGRPEGRDEARVEGTVTAQLPSGLYQVDVEGPHRITAHIGGGAERNFVRVLVGDRVVVELTPRDTTRGRIVRKA